MCVIVKTSVFIVLPIIRNQSKPKTISHTVFETFINKDSRYKTEKVLKWALWVRDARNIHKSFFIKNHYWNLKLSKVAVPSIMKCPPLNEKKNHQKGASQLKITKIVHITRDTRDIEMGGKMKNEKDRRRSTT